jgi:hypothetical protein
MSIRTELNRDVTVGYICASYITLAISYMSLDREHSDPRYSLRGNYKYALGMIGTRLIAMCSCVEAIGDTEDAEDAEDAEAARDAANQMMRTCPSIKLLILLSSEAGTVPGCFGPIRICDMVSPRSVEQNGDNGKIDLVTDVVPITFTGMETARPRSLGEEIATLIAKNNIWGSECERPAGDASFAYHNGVLLSQGNCSKCGWPPGDASLAYHDGVLISNGSCQKDANHRDPVVVPLNPGSIVCFDNSHIWGLSRDKKDIDWMDVDVVPVLGVSHSCDKNVTDDRGKWEKYASVAAAAYAKRIVLGLDNENRITRRAENRIRFSNGGIENYELWKRLM